MAILRPSEIRKMQKKDMDKRLIELRLELAKVRGSISMGASAQSPGRVGEVRRAIARIKTIESEMNRKEAETKSAGQGPAAGLKAASKKKVTTEKPKQQSKPAAKKA
jgi:large subunit ribosomal protein L29